MVLSRYLRRMKYEKHIIKVQYYGTSRVSETNGIWKNILRGSNMVLSRYLRQMEYGKTLRQSNIILLRYLRQMK